MSGSWRTVGWLGPMILLLGAAGQAGAADPAAVRFRRVFVPQADIDQQIRGLLPLKREEFERRIERAAALAQGSSQVEHVQVSQAVYRARAEGAFLVDGRAELTVALRRELPGLLPLGPCNLALGDAAWGDSPPRPAQIGTGPGGQIGCIVTRSGQLKFDWTLAGQSDGRDGAAFRLQLPPSPINRLEIELPPGTRLTTDRGLASRAASAGTKNLWLVEAGGARELALQVSRSSPEARDKPLVLVHETTVYSVHQATVDVETSLQLDVLQQPLSELQLLLDEPLQLTQVRLGEQTLTAVPLPEAAGQRQVVVTLPEPLEGEGIVLQLSGVASWAGSGRQVLPRVRLSGGAWQDGRATVTAPAALQLVAAPQGGCWQTVFSPSSPLRLEEQWQFQYYLPDAAIQIAAAATAAPLNESSAVSLEFQASQVQATLTAELSAVTAPRFEVQAQIPRAWIVDAIDVQPGDMLEDRTLQTRGGGPQSLRLALRRPIAVGRPLTVVIRAHRRRPPAGQPMSGDFCALARFATVREARRLVELRSSDAAARIHLSGDDELRRIDPQALSPSQRKLFGSLPGPLLFELDQQADALQIRLAPAVPRYRADTFVRAEVHDDQLRQTCRMRITPEESLLEAVTVRFAPPPPEPIHWSIGGESSREVAVHRIQPPGAAAEEAVYEVKLQRPRRTTFDIVAEFAAATSERADVSLVSVPAAASQAGLVEVHATDGSIGIQAPELQAIPPLNRQAPAATTLRGAFRYEPGRAGSLKVGALPAGRGLPLAWIESLQVTSRISTDGSGDHEALLVVESPGRRSLLLTLPPPAANLRAEIEGQPVSGRLTGAKPDAYAIPLPDGSESVNVRLTYSTPAADPDWRPWRCRAEAPLPQPVLPVLLSSWQVQLAPGLELAGSQATPQGQTAAADWQARLLTGLVPHHERPLPDRSPAALESAGWTNYALPFGAEPAAAIEMVRPAVMQLWGWCLALAIAAVVHYLSPTAGRMAALAAVAAAACFLMPREYAPLAAGMLVGLVLGAAAGMLLPAASASLGLSRTRTTRAPSTPGPRAAIGLLILLAAIAGLVKAAHGQQAGPEAALFRVVIPIDDDRQPVGDYVFLDPELYDALLKLTDREPSRLPDWLVASATYRPSLAPRAEESSSLDGVSAEFEVETFTANAAIELAFERKQIHLIEGRARLDGKPLLTEWSADGRLTFDVPLPGKHRLELAFSPAAAPKDGLLCDVAIPAVASSRVILPEEGHVQVDAGLGAAASDASGQPMTQLGAAGRLLLRMATGRLQSDAAAVLETDQLVLWKVRPGSVIAEGRFRIRPIGGQVSDVTIQLDPRLRLLPLPPGSPIARHWIESMPGSARLHLALDKPVAAETVVQASFLWTGATGIGSFTLPRIAIQSDKRTGDWAAVSLAGGLAWKRSPAAASTVSSDSTASVWTEAIPEGAVVLDLASTSAIELSTEPERPRVQAWQQLACSVSSKSMSARYTAQLTNVPPHALQHRLRVSPGLHVSQLSVRDGQRTIRSQWSQGADATLVIQLAQAPPAEMEITLEGRLPVGRLPGTPALPLAQYLGAAEDEMLLTIHEQAGIQVKAPQGDANWRYEDDPDLGRYREGLGRLAATLRRVGGPNAVAPQASVAESTRELGGVVLSRLVPGEGGWRLEVECLLSVQSGRLETLRLDLPQSLAGPLEIVPAAEHQLTAVPGQTLQRLVIRPQRVLDDELRLVIRAPLRASADQAAIPLAVSIVDSPQVRQLMALPRRSADQQFEWETSGLQAVDPATLKLPAESVAAGYELFESVADRPTATPHFRSGSSPVARVLLADHELRVGAGRRVSGKTIFDIVPGGARRFTLAMPPGVHLVHAAVEGVPAQLTPHGGGQWVVEAASDRASQRMEVVYGGLVSETAGSVGHVAVPRLVDLPPERSLWSVRGSEVVAVRRGTRPVDRDRHEHNVIRLESLAAAIDVLSTVTVSDLPESAFLESLGAWHQRFREAQRLLDDDVSPPLAERAAAAEQTVQHALDRLMESGFSLPPEPANPAAGAADDWPWQWAASGAQATAEIVVAGSAGRSSDARLRWALALVAAGLVASWGLSRGPVQTWLTQHAHFAVAMMGALLLAAGIVPWLGAIVLLLALWRAVHSAWPRSTADAGSTILRRRA